MTFLCDPIWHVSSRSGDGRLACKLLYPSLLFTFPTYVGRPNNRETLTVCLCTGKRSAEILNLLVRRGGKASLNHPEWSRQSKGASPLHTAARHGQVDNADVLLKLGADVKVVDASGQTALHVAAAHEITGWT